MPYIGLLISISLISLTSVELMTRIDELEALVKKENRAIAKYIVKAAILSKSEDLPGRS